MARLIGAALNTELYERLRGTNIEAFSEQVIQIFTVDEHGWAHPAILSYFEVAAPDRANIRIAPYSSSSTTRNMRRTGKVTLSIIDTRMAYYVKGTVSELAPQMACAPENAKLNITVEQVLVDMPDPALEPDAYLASGVRYVNPNRSAELAKGRRIIQELLA